MSGMYTMVAGTLYSAYSKKKADDQSAGLLQQEAGQSVASGIQGMIQANRKTQYVASSARARSVAGGLASTSPSVETNVGQIRGQGEYNALTDLYQGSDRASELDSRAIGMGNEGNAAVVGGLFGATNTLLKSNSGAGSNSFYDSYG